MKRTISISNLNANSYKSAIIRIIISVTVFSFFVSLNSFCAMVGVDINTFENDYPIVSLIFALIRLVIGVCAILCVYGGVGEIIIVAEKRFYTSFLVPIVATIICFAILCSVVWLNILFKAEDKWIIYFISIVVGALCGIGIFVCVPLLLTNADNRKNIKLKYNDINERDCELKAFDDLIDLIDKCDIVDIIILSESITKIGATSNCNYGSSRFYDKRFYIDEEEWSDISEFSDRLKSICTDGQVCVYSIDGVALKNKSRKSK